MCDISVCASVWMHTRVVLVFYACVVKKNTLVILISFSIRFSIWMVVKCFVTIQITWIVAKDISRPSVHISQSLDGHWRFFATIQSYIVNIFITFSANWWWNWCGSRAFRDWRMCLSVLRAIRAFRKLCKLIWLIESI